MRALRPLASGLFVLLLASAAAAQPANDNVFTSFPITTETRYTGTTTGATVDGSTPSATCSSLDGNNAVWWYFHATSAGTVTIDLAGSTFDTVLAVYTFDVTEVACNDDNGGVLQSRAEISVLAGQRYAVRVTGWNGEVGDIAMEVTGTPITGPAGDAREGALFVQLDALASESNVGATAESDEPVSSCRQGTATGGIWRGFTAPASGSFTVSTAGSSFDTILDVWQSGQLGVPSIGCNDDANSTTQSSVTLALVGGQTYLIRVSGFSGSEGDIRLQVTQAATTAAEDGPDAPLTFAAPSPNPAAGAVRLAATLAAPGAATVEVFDALGRSVAVVHDGDLPAGDATWTWDPAAQPAGVYVVRLTTEAGTATRMVSVVR